MKKILTLIVIMSILLFCGTIETIAQESLLPTVETDETQPVVEKIFVRQFKLEGNTFFSKEDLAQIFSPYENRELSVEELQEVREQLLRYYIDNGYATAQVIIPTQKVQEGEVILQVQEGELAKSVLPPVETDETQLSAVEKVFVRKFNLEGNTVFSDKELGVILADYENREITAEELQEVKNKLTKYYIVNGYHNSGAMIPDQNMQDDMITIRIIEGKLSDITISGNTWLRSNYIRKRLALATKNGKKPFNINTMQEYLRLLEQDLRIGKGNVHADFNPGLERGEGVLNVEVEEARPYHLTLRANNQNSPSIGAYRGEVELQHLNLTGWGDALTLQYARSEGLDDYSANYTIPITHWDTTLSFDVDYSESWVVTDPFEQLDIRSETTTYSATLRHPFYKRIASEFAMELKLEKSESKLFILQDGIGLPGEPENQITALRFSQDWVNRSMTQVFAARSTFSFGLDMWDATILDEDPDGKFFSWLGQFQWLRRITPFNSQLLCRAILRLSDDPVLPAEKFAIGGLSTVRGYRENQMTTDNGAIASLEWRIPIFKLKIPGVSKGEQDGEIQLCPFFDFGKGWNTDSDDPKDDTIYSTGAGLRWMVNQRIYAEVYWGKAWEDVEDPGEYDLQDDGIHFQVNVGLF